MVDLNEHTSSDSFVYMNKRRLKFSSNSSQKGYTKKNDIKADDAYLKD